MLSLLWSGFLFTTAWVNRNYWARIWLCQAQDMPWLLPEEQQPQPPTRLQVIIGRPRLSRSSTILGGLKRWILEQTMFRRFGHLEPLSHCLIRGGVAILFWIILLAYGILNCVIDPIRQFTLAKRLPTNYLMEDSQTTTTFGHVNGFIVSN